MLKERLGQYKENFEEISKRIDIIALLKGLLIVAVIYLLLFFYIYFNSANTIEKLKSQIIVENIPISYVENVPKHTASTLMSIIDGLHEKTKAGLLPIIRKKDSLTSFRAYQHPFSFKDIGNKPVISFIVVNYGLSKEQSLSALDLLPSEVSFILSPYASLPSEWIAMAQSKGHEVWLNLPIQNKRSHDLGENAIYHHSSSLEKKKNMYKSLAKTQGYIGISNYTDETLDSAKEHYLELAEDLYMRGLGILELNPNANTYIKNKALRMGAPYIKADLEVFRIRGKKNSFETLEAIAQKKGHAIAIIPNYPTTIKNLAVWIMKVAQADYIVAPVSAIYDLPLYKSSSRKGQTHNQYVAPKNLRSNDHMEPRNPTKHSKPAPSPEIQNNH